jgi:hypothetical protein
MGNEVAVEAVVPPRREQIDEQKAIEKLKGGPWLQLRKMVRSHIRSLEEARDDYLRKEAAKDFWRKVWLIQAAPIRKDHPSKEKLKQLVANIDSSAYLHEGLMALFVRIEEREKRIKALAADMIAFIEEGKEFVLPPLANNNPYFEYLDFSDLDYSTEFSSSEEDEEEECPAVNPRLYYA